MSIPMPQDYAENESGVKVVVTQVTGGMSLIGPDFFDLGELPVGHFVVDYPDKPTEIVSPAALAERFTKIPNGYWSSIDEARSFAMEMQYAIDHHIGNVITNTWLTAMPSTRLIVSVIS